MVRDDISNRLVHLTKGDEEKPLFTLMHILNDRALRGGTGHIMGSFTCVCFSEAPISKLGVILGSSEHKFRYRPYGLMFRKEWIFERGGRPVIYQPARDFDLLHDEKKHLHVTFDLTGDKQVDFTWEREWRLRSDCLSFGPDDVTVIVPNRWVEAELRKNYHEEAIQNARASTGDSTAIAEDPWHYVVLEDLGVKVDHGLF